MFFTSIFYNIGNNNYYYDEIFPGKKGFLMRNCTGNFSCKNQQ